MAVPIMSYGFVLWGIKNNDILEKLYLRFYRYILKVKNSSLDCTRHGELGDYSVDILLSVINFLIQYIVCY